MAGKKIRQSRVRDYRNFMASKERGMNHCVMTCSNLLKYVMLRLPVSVWVLDFARQTNASKELVLLQVIIYDYQDCIQTEKIVLGGGGRGGMGTEYILPWVDLLVVNGYWCSVSMRYCAVSAENAGGEVPQPDNDAWILFSLHNDVDRTGRVSRVLHRNLLEKATPEPPFPVYFPSGWLGT